jgi:hypothetical protein
LWRCCFYKDAAPLALGKVTPGTMRFFAASARDILAGINKGNEKKLGDWGFVVDDTAAPAKAPIKKLNT